MGDRECEGEEGRKSEKRETGRTGVEEMTRWWKRAENGSIRTGGEGVREIGRQNREQGRGASSRMQETTGKKKGKERKEEREYIKTITYLFSYFLVFVLLSITLPLSHTVIKKKEKKNIYTENITNSNTDSLPCELISYLPFPSFHSVLDAKW